MTTRIISWLIFGFLLSLLPLVIVALMEWKPNDNFLGILTNEELLAVAFTLGGASGIDALTSSRPWRRTQVGVGGLTVFSALATVALYVMFKSHSHHLSPEFIKSVELIAYSTTAILSFLSEIVAEL